MSGIFITFEGIDGVGKSSIINALSSKIANEKLITKEPSDDLEISKDLRNLILDSKNLFNPKEQLYFFVADRLQHWFSKILPALNQKKTVLCDRFHDSTIAYQGNTEEIKLELFKMYDRFFRKPDLTFLIQSKESIIEGRLAERKKKNAFDKKDSSFFNEVKQNYNWIQEQEKTALRKRIYCIDNNESIEQAVQKIHLTIQGFIQNNKPLKFN